MKTLLLIIVLCSGGCTPVTTNMGGDEPAEDVIMTDSLSPCQDKLYIALQKKNIDSLSAREYEYFIMKSKQCSEYSGLQEKLKVKKEETSSSSSAQAIRIGIGAALGIAGIIITVIALSK